MKADRATPVVCDGCVCADTDHALCPICADALDLARQRYADRTAQWEAEVRRRVDAEDALARALEPTCG